MKTDVVRIQSRVVRTLSLAQIFSGLGTGSTLALGSILAVELSGSEAWAGSINTALTLGTALSAIPLSQFALRRGRRASLTVGLVGAIFGSACTVAAIFTQWFPLLLIGTFLVGMASTVNLQARFAVTDLAEPQHRGRDLSLVVWAITVGAVIGPNLVGPGAALSKMLGIPPSSGPFLFSTAGMVVGTVIIWVFLKPDPLLVRREIDATPVPPATKTSQSWVQGWHMVRSQPTAAAAVLAVVAAHAVMVAIMAMTPLHMQHEAGDHAGHPDTIALIGLTISLHIAGMYAFSPVMGWMTDRIGALTTVVIGMTVLLASVAFTGLGGSHMTAVTIGLILLGLGWSAATVAGSTLLVSALTPDQRVPAQGFSDGIMSLAGAIGSAAAGPIMGLFGFSMVSAVSAALIVGTTLVMLRMVR